MNVELGRVARRVEHHGVARDQPAQRDRVGLGPAGGDAASSTSSGSIACRLWSGPGWRWANSRPMRNASGGPAGSPGARTSARAPGDRDAARLLDDAGEREHAPRELLDDGRVGGLLVELRVGVGGRRAGRSPARAGGRRRAASGRQLRRGGSSPGGRSRRTRGVGRAGLRECLADEQGRRPLRAPGTVGERDERAVAVVVELVPGAIAARGAARQDAVAVPGEREADRGLERLGGDVEPAVEADVPARRDRGVEPRGDGGDGAVEGDVLVGRLVRGGRGAGDRRGGEAGRGRQGGSQSASHGPACRVRQPGPRPSARLRPRRASPPRRRRATPTSRRAMPTTACSRASPRGPGRPGSPPPRRPGLPRARAR